MSAIKRLRAGTPLLVVALLATACGADTSAETSTAPSGGRDADCTAVAGVPAPAELLDRLDLGEVVVWSDVAADDATVNAVGTAEGAGIVPPVLEEVQEAMAAQGWEVFSLDDEGFEAEVLARDPDDVLLGVTLRESGCPTRVDVTLSVTDYAALE